MILKKRTQNPLGVDIVSTTFIFVTLKLWNHRKSIEEKKINESKSKYHWSDIQIFDASKMCLWIEKCPAVSNWMFSVMGKKYKWRLYGRAILGRICNQYNTISKKKSFS